MVISKRKNFPNSVNIYIHSSFNNTMITITDKTGRTLMWNSSGTSGFKGSRKSSPFAASKAGEIIGKKAINSGITEAKVFVSGPGSGRESAIKAIFSEGINITSITDITKFPFNGTRAPKPRKQ